MICKTMKQDENDQNYKKESTPVVGRKPNGKSQLRMNPRHGVWGCIEKADSKIESFG
jgi:hypothetical protein